MLREFDMFVEAIQILHSCLPFPLLLRVPDWNIICLPKMRLLAPVLLALGITTFSKAHTVPSGPASLLRRGNRESDEQTIVAWELTGSCFSYFDYSDPEKAARPCKKYCKDVEHKEGAVGVRKHPTA